MTGPVFQMRTKNYHAAFAFAESLGKRAEWEAKAKQVNRENICPCPVCHEKGIEHNLTFDLVIPSTETIVEFEYQGVRFCVSCSRCGHKDCFEVISEYGDEGV